VNLSASAATRVVGGMATHWTCATPRQLKGIERSDLFTDDEWDSLYTEAEGYLRTSRDEFEGSLRHQLVKNTLLSSPTLVPNGREVLSLPLACKRSQTNPSFVTWSASNTVLGDTVKKLHLLSNHQCTLLQYDEEDEEKEIFLAVVKNLELMHGRLYICARKYVVCAGAVLTPQILYKSGFRAEKGSLPALVCPYFTHLNDACADGDAGALPDGTDDGVLSSDSPRESSCPPQRSSELSSLGYAGASAKID
jgi:pyranose oxidase